MIPCLVLGDSIAVGVAQQMPECRAEAKVGISSTQLLEKAGPSNQAERVVISLGANDSAAVPTLENLLDLRKSIHAQVVYWLMPASTKAARAAIRAVAARYGDRMIDTAPYVGPDRLHPTGSGYKQLALLTETPR